jgi:hypothetical protein
VASGTRLPPNLAESNVEGGGLTAIRRSIKISLNFEQKRVKVIEIVGILKVFLFTALDQMTIHGAVVMDFLFIQPFGWIRIIIAWGRKSQKNPSDATLMQRCVETIKCFYFSG